MPSEPDDDLSAPSGARRASPTASNAAGLAAGLAGLASLVAGTGTLEQLLTEIANFTLVAIPGADGAGVTMLESGESDTIVASDPFVRDVDNVQYRLGEGPCISAASSGATAMSLALGDDSAWPTFGPMAAQLGVHSALSLPLVLDGDVLGALNVYAHAHDAFDEDGRRIGERFARAAAVAVHNAKSLHQAKEAVARLELAVTNRAMIDRAVGIIMSRTGLSADDAFVRLRIMSQHEHVKLVKVADNLVAESVRRAVLRQRSSDSAPD